MTKKEMIEKIEVIEKEIEALKIDWIPVRERLPELDTYVLATLSWGEVTIAERIRENGWFIREGFSNAGTDDIIAWMPLPAPYEPKERGDEE